MRESFRLLRQRCKIVITKLERSYNAHETFLRFSNPFELLVGTILSAQSTDKSVNLVKNDLFNRYPTLQTLARARPSEVARIIQPTGLQRVKARNIVACAKQLLENYHGNIPSDIDELTALPGVGRKTAHCVLQGAFGIPSGIIVDTHVMRLSQRLHWTEERDPGKVEEDLVKVVPQGKWIVVSKLLIQHGRSTCSARSPQCDRCVIQDECPSAFVVS